jgi:hypothetical protein
MVVPFQKYGEHTENLPFLLGHRAIFGGTNISCVYKNAVAYECKVMGFNRRVVIRLSAPISFA